MVTEADILLLKSRINELEDRLNFLYQRLGIENSDPSEDPIRSPQIQDALRRGNKIEAIKIYRELTGTGLAEANRPWTISHQNWVSRALCFRSLVCYTVHSQLGISAPVLCI